MRRKHSLQGLEELEQRLLLKGPADAPVFGLAPPRGTPNVVYVDTNPFDPVTNGNRLRAAVNNAQSNQTIVIMPGEYQLPQTLFVGFSSNVQNLTIRGWGEDYNQVHIYGRGMENADFQSVPHGFSIYNGQNITIANLSIGDVWQHAVELQGAQGADNVRLYHVRLFDTGEQFIKANPGGDGADNVTIEHSLIEYTNAPPTVDHQLGSGYFNGISAFQADNWLIRYNLWRNFHTPDTSDNRYNPAILMWGGSANTIVEGNTFIDVDRAVNFGLIDSAQPDHTGGIIRNNFVWQRPGLFSASRRENGDSLLNVYDSPNTKVYHNTVMTNGNQPRSIEVRFTNVGVEFRNNLADAPVFARDGGAFTQSGNYLGATPSMFVNPAAGDLHLLVNASTQANVIDKEAVIATSLKDWDGGTRNVNLADIGADEITPTGLSFSWQPNITSTGFTVTFNQAVEPSVLNLYDQGGVLGIPDVTLVGATIGTVAGSAIINNDRTVLTFVRTGGVLLPDTYTFTLRSASDGFRTSQNQYLDGNRDHGYVHTFVVTPRPANTVIIGVPNLARGPGQAANVPSTSMGLPLTITNAQMAQTVAITLSYNPALLTITDFLVAPGIPATRDYQSAFAGSVNLTIYGTSRLTTDPGTVVLGTFVASVPDTAPYSAKHILDLASPFVFVSPTQYPAIDDDGVHVAAYLGDVTGNARLSSADAVGILRQSVGLDSGFAAYQLLDPAIVADINSNWRISSLDANRVMQEALGIDRPEIPPLPASPPTIVFGGPDPLLSLPAPIRGWAGDTVTVPVLLDVSDGLSTLDLALSYDTSRLEVVSAADIRRGSLTQDFDLFATSLDPAAGTIRVGLGQTGNALQGQGSGSVLEITFRIRSDAPVGAAFINLMNNVGSTQTQLNEGGLDLNPDPTNTVGDALDGWIWVTKSTRTSTEKRILVAGRDWVALLASLSRRTSRARQLT